MIRVVVQAGFGNQLFQYATAYALAKDLRQELELDVSFYNEKANTDAINSRENNLKNLQLNNPKFVSMKNGFRKYRYITRLGFFQRTKINGQEVPIICEDIIKCREDQRYLFQKIGDSGAVLYGFWQNTKYFEKYMLDLKKQFVPKYELDSQVRTLLAKIERENSVGVHIRRGDFVGLGWNKEKKYYDKGMATLKQCLPNCKFFIVTDDVKWAIEQYKNRLDVNIVNVNTKTKDIDEFFLLSSCKHQIISESTFGWWAAYLNTYKNKIVVAPIEAQGEIFEHDWYKI